MRRAKFGFRGFAPLFLSPTFFRLSFERQRTSVELGGGEFPANHPDSKDVRGGP